MENKQGGKGYKRNWSGGREERKEEEEERGGRKKATAKCQSAIHRLYLYSW